MTSQVREFVVTFDGELTLDECRLGSVAVVLSSLFDVTEELSA
jgi:hypothetical protein